MKTTIKIAYSENSKAVLAETKLEIEQDSSEGNPDFSQIQAKAKEIFEDAQNYALTKTMRRAQEDKNGSNKRNIETNERQWLP